MCGINVIIDKSLSIDGKAIGRMMFATAQRGPDHSKEKRYNLKGAHLYFGANRLRILDVTEQSDQPFQDHTGRYVIIFNGEIYNYYDLKNELIENGGTFNTSSDTEVLLNWLIWKGRQGISSLNGMFAFVFADLESGCILAARDRWGMKPLYYADSGSQIIISSELRGVLQSGLIKKNLNRDQVDHYLRFKYARRPESFYENIFELEPGGLFIYENGKTNIVSWKGPANNLGVDEHGKGGLQLVSKVEDLLRSSLVTHLQSDVPAGLLLSGGVDSTLLLALAREEGYTMPSFSIVNRKQEANYGTGDYKYARLAAMQYRSEHTVLEVDDEILKDFEFFVGQLDQPVADSGAWMTWLICREAAGSVKVLLSGAGADELFAGYHRHRAFYWYLNNRKTLNLLLPFLHLSGSVLPDGWNVPWRKQIRLLRKWAQSLDKSPETTWNRMISLPEFTGRAIEAAWTGQRDVDGMMQRALENDRNEYLISDVLAISDRMSMWHGLEMRMPYLDGYLSDLARQISPEQLLEHGGKGILKEILNAYGGKKFSKRNKEGFGLPVGNWFKNKKHDYLWEMFSEQSHLIFDFVKREEISGLLKRHRKGSADLSQELWSVLVLGHWLAKEFE